MCPRVCAHARIFFFFPSTGPEFLVPVFQVSVNAKKEIYINIYIMYEKNLPGYRVKKTPQVLSFLSSLSLETV